ncbi:hypothetical protein [Vallitalea okinawensis]|uniref:hypothetical protein n=1 Tax=Vallitalea okinawensis TaxID=2078660 RepID=UPI000CFBBA94|nr:hypothetical protein [Vallitalea okinawensis]
MMPNFITKKLFNKLEVLGKIYKKTHTYDEKIIKEMKQPYKIAGVKLKIMKLIKKIGVMDVSWNKLLKGNNAFEERYSRPFAIDSVIDHQS